MPFKLTLYCLNLVNLMAAQWKPSKEIKKWTIRRPCEVFQQKYDGIINQLTKISCMDDLLSGKVHNSL